MTNSESPGLEEILDELCQDSLEVPLSHVDGLPESEGEISHRFRLVRDGIRSLGERAERLERALQQAVADLVSANEALKQQSGNSLGSLQAEANIAHYRAVAEQEKEQC